MRSIRGRLSTAQRIVCIVALGMVAAIIGSYVASLSGSGPASGWFGYAPLEGVNLYGRGGLSPAGQLLVWLGLVAVWAGVSLWLLHDDYGDREPEGGGSQDG